MEPQWLELCIWVSEVKRNDANFGGRDQHIGVLSAMAGAMEIINDDNDLSFPLCLFQLLGSVGPNLLAFWAWWEAWGSVCRPDPAQGWPMGWVHEHMLVQPHVPGSGYVVAQYGKGPCYLTHGASHKSKNIAAGTWQLALPLIPLLPNFYNLEEPCRLDDTAMLAGGRAPLH